MHAMSIQTETSLSNYSSARISRCHVLLRNSMGLLRARLALQIHLNRHRQASSSVMMAGTDARQVLCLVTHSMPSGLGTLYFSSKAVLSQDGSGQATCSVVTSVRVSWENLTRPDRLFLMDSGQFRTLVRGNVEW
jgi:hypothetical protein